MTTLQQTRFIGNIERALNRTGSGRPRLEDLIQTEPSALDIALLQGIQNRERHQLLALLDQMTEVGLPLNMQVMAVENHVALCTAIAKIAREKDPEWGHQKSVVAWNHPLIQTSDLAAALDPHGIPIYVADAGPEQGQAFRSQAETALIGVTAADYALAETATLTMKNRAGQPLYISLLPSIHVAVIRPQQILTNIKELYTLLKWDPAQQKEGLTDTMSFITGPSKTADIEATLVHGAHGPRDLYVFVLLS